MATMTLTNGATVNLTIDELAQLINTAQAVSVKPATKATKKATPKATKATPKAAKPATKAEKKAAKVRREHDAVLDSKRVGRMTATAQAKFTAAGIETKASKQGAWVWIYPTNGQGRTAEFKAVKLAKGWKYSPKRGAWYRDFKGATC